MIYLLTGTNEFAARQALDKLVTAALNKHGAHAVERVDGEALDVARLPQLLQGGSLFALERLVVLRDAGRNKALWEALGDWAERIPAGVTLVVFEPTPDKRTRAYKQLQKHGKLHDFPELSEYELARWAVSMAKAEGSTLDAKTAAYLVRQVGTDQWLLASELSKLVAAGGDITQARIDQLVEPNPQASAFELLDAVLQGQQVKAAELLARLKASDDPYKLYGLLVSQVQTLAVVATAAGKAPDVIAKEAGIHPFVIKKIQPLARRLRYAQVQEVIAAVALADIQMKSTGVEPWFLLEQCLGKIAIEVA